MKAIQCTTNWRIASGSLEDFITFESSVSSAADDDYEDQDAGAPAAKSPLVLFPPSSDSKPCDLTVTFAQKHEVRQVYVRSTARVYEMYYATKLQQTNEYLCTVRCGIAMRDVEVLQAPSIEEASLANPEELVTDLEDRRLKDNGNVRTNEDDWVEVKASDNSLLSNGENLSVKPQGSSQDMHEATAEINDVDPCISITLRLLSLQDRGCLFVDEVYIFADPIDPTDSPQEVGGAESSASSSLMAMFMPTLLQLSRARDASRLQDKQTFDESRNKKIQEPWTKTNVSAKSVNEIQQEVKHSTSDDREVNMPEAIGTTAKPAELETSLEEVSDTKIELDSSSNDIGNVLHLLVSRVSRIEDVLLRFEERLLIPINSIDSRLQQVERKLEELTEKSQNPEFPSGTRIVAPEFQSSDTDPDTSYANKSKDRDAEVDELSGKSHNQFLSCTRISAPEFPCSDTEADSCHTNQTENCSNEYKEEDTSTSDQSVEMVDPKFDSNLPPGIEMASPVAENVDDGEENHSLVSKSLEEKPKHSMSINDALASALTGFLSSTSTAERNYTQALAVKAPDFSSEEDGGDTDKQALADTQEISNPSACSGATEKIMKDSVSSSLCISSTENEAEGTRFSEKGSQKTVKGVHEQCQQTGHFTEAGENGGFRDATVNRSTPDEADDQAVLNAESVTLTEAKEKPKIDDVLHCVLGFSRASSSVDFETPILDVIFNSQQSSDNRSSIEAFFSGMTESNAESVAHSECVDDTSQCNLMSVNDGEITGPPVDTLDSLELKYCDVSETHLNLEGEAEHDYHGYGREDMSATSLI